MQLEGRDVTDAQERVHAVLPLTTLSFSLDSVIVPGEI